MKPRAVYNMFEFFRVGCGIRTHDVMIAITALYIV